MYLISSITKNVINGENFEDRVEIEDEEYITSTTEVAEVKEDIDDVDFILEEEEYYSKEDVVYFTDKDLDEIDFEGLVCIGNEFEEQPLHSLIEDFVIVDAV